MSDMALKRRHGSVVQQWLSVYCSFKQQTVVLSALRGCDGKSKNDISKRLTRRFRGSILKSAEDRAPEGSFMHPGAGPKELHLMLSDIDHYPVHWLTHFAHAAQIVSVYHPIKEEAAFWGTVYRGIVEALHFNVETVEQMEERLSDSCDGD